MSQADFTAMTNEELKQYIVKHRDDQEALSAYLERRNQQDFPVIANVKDIDFDEKLQTAISQKLGNPTAT